MKTRPAFVYPGSAAGNPHLPGQSVSRTDARRYAHLFETPFREADKAFWLEIAIAAAAQRWPDVVDLLGSARWRNAEARRRQVLLDQDRQLTFLN